MSNGFWGGEIALRAYLRPVWGKSDETKTGVPLARAVWADGEALETRRDEIEI